MSKCIVYSEYVLKVIHVDDRANFIISIIIWLKLFLGKINNVNFERKGYILWEI